VRLYEKGGKQHQVPAHHNLDEYMEAYIKVAGLHDDLKGSSVVRTDLHDY
jgi:integrase/recombinase XerD